MALLRSVGVRCRLHGFTIHKALQRGVVPELVYPIAPEEIIHSWVEVETENGWVNLEGFILDAQFLSALQTTFSDTSSLCGYGAGTDCLSDPPSNGLAVTHTSRRRALRRILDYSTHPTPSIARTGNRSAPYKTFCTETSSVTG